MPIETPLTLPTATILEMDLVALGIILGLALGTFGLIRMCEKLEAAE